MLLVLQTLACCGLTECTSLCVVLSTYVCLLTLVPAILSSNDDDVHATLPRSDYNVHAIEGIRAQ